MAPQSCPKVTGLSPKEGPVGTRITIRGENLGYDARDLIGLTICGMDCLLSAEWKSPSKIVARAGAAKGKGDIVVTTRSGGQGICMVKFNAYTVQTGPLQESAVWVDEIDPLGTTGVGVPAQIQAQEDILGLSDEPNTEKIPEDELQNLFPGGCGDPTAENFVPAWYLLENYHGTSFDDLKAGLAHLKRRQEQQSKGPVAFMKSHLTAVMDCQTTLASLYTHIQDDKNFDDLIPK